MEAQASYDEVYIISDLHMGGEGEFQMFAAGKRLVKFIDGLTGTSPSRNVALVINGDMVDFLAEPNPTYFDINGAVGRLNRIAGDASFKPVFEALERFVKKIRRTLIINMGNHDLELALPWVREHFLDLLSGGDERARGRIRLVVDGTGVRCKVGKADVLCLRGNEVDPANYADYHHLRKIGFQVQSGNDVDPWTPNGGTRLVIDVMNEIKKDHPFVDLLKPIVDAVVPTLLVLDVNMADKIDDALRLISRVQTDAVRGRFGWLSDDDLLDAVEAAPEGQLLKGMVDETFPEWAEEADVSLDALLEEIEAGLEKDPLAAESSSDSDAEMLGAGTIIGLQMKKFVNWIRGRNKPADRKKLLFEALQPLCKVEASRDAFASDTRDRTYNELEKQVGGDIDFLVTGHTHMHKAIRRRDGLEGMYYNCGTWVQLIRIDLPYLDSLSAFTPVYDALSAGSIKALQAVKGLIMDRHSVVVIKAEGDAAVGELFEVRATGAMDPVAGTRYKRG
ncbi:MAG: UDP-2,3-diacylglucosamine pyrophosphatase LpxH [Verrucomicrobiales bacterium]|jgi:UDP-2,3-diacylglucosamine pyrophosphatase LpxH